MVNRPEGAKKVRYSCTMQVQLLKRELEQKLFEMLGHCPQDRKNEPETNGDRSYPGARGKWRPNCQMVGSSAMSLENTVDTGGGGGAGRI